jgi:pseudouridine kinase
VSRIVCIGAAAVDRTYIALDKLQSDTSNPVARRDGYGGVARNVAESLTRLGHSVELVSSVGDDEPGRALLADLERIGVGTRHVTRRKERRTAEYAAVLERDGVLAFGLAEMAIFDDFAESEGDDIRPTLERAEAIFADCNLPRAALESLLSFNRTSGNRLVVDTVSAAKAVRLPHALSGIDLLFVNEIEAEALLGPLTASEAASALRLRGAGAVVVSSSERGLLLADAAETTTFEAASDVPVVDVTGAGDALIAGTLHGLVRGEALRAALRTGMSLAALTLACEGAVRADLAPALLA